MQSQKPDPLAQFLASNTKTRRTAEDYLVKELLDLAIRMLNAEREALYAEIDQLRLEKEQGQNTGRSPPPR